MMHVITVGIEPDVETDEHSRNGLKPFRESIALVFAQARLDFEAAATADRIVRWRKAEGFALAGAFLIPARAQLAAFKIIRKNHGRERGNTGIRRETRDQAWSLRKIAASGQIGKRFIRGAQGGQREKPSNQEEGNDIQGELCFHAGDNISRGELNVALFRAT
jgi:hypothetical protein